MKNNKKIKNVFLGHTLEEYKAIYDIDKTIHIDKATVDEFNKSHKEDPKDSPLEGRLWWLIGDTYYEVNSINHKEEYKYNKKNKGPGFKIAMASILGGLGIAGVGTGTFYVIKSTGMKDPITDREIEITGNEKNNVTFAKQVSSDGIQVKLTCKDETKEVNKVEISIGNKTLNENEYSFDLSTSTISIKKTVLKENEGNIGINPTLSKKIIHVTGVRIKDSLNKKLGDTISIDELQINVLPENADNKNYTLSTTTPSIVQITGTTIKCIAQGNGNIKVGVVKVPVVPFYVEEEYTEFYGPGGAEGVRTELGYVQLDEIKMDGETEVAIPVCTFKISSELDWIESEGFGTGKGFIEPLEGSHIPESLEVGKTYRITLQLRDGLDNLSVECPIVIIDDDDVEFGSQLATLVYNNGKQEFTVIPDETPFIKLKFFSGGA